MKREQFLTLLSGFVIPSFSFGRKRERPGHLPQTFARPKKGFKIGKGEARLQGALQLKGINSNIVHIKVAGSDTNGDLFIYEETTLTQGRGAPMHLHESQDETVYILEGDFRFKAGDESFSLKAGDTVFLPRGLRHAWRQDSEEGKLLVVVQPAMKLEALFVKLAALDHDPMPVEIEALFAQHAVNVVGPSLRIDE